MPRRSDRALMFNFFLVGGDGYLKIDGSNFDVVIVIAINFPFIILIYH